MTKISEYIENNSPELGDKLIGTKVGGDPSDVTYNFTLEDLINLASENITLQNILDAGNEATQDIRLIGDIFLENLTSNGIVHVGSLNELQVASNLSFNGSVLGVDSSIKFNSDASSTGGERLLAWNETDGTLDLGLKGGNVTLQIGQELVTRVVNKSGSDLLEADFKVVKVLGAQGQRLSVNLAQADSDINSATTLGVVTETILNNQEGFITTTGLVNNINATGAKSFGGLETWNDGDVLYLDPINAGYITNVKPITPEHLITIGYVVNAANNNGKIYVKVDNGYELDELHDVKITTPVNKDLLIYDESLGIWENNALDYTSENLTIDGQNLYVNNNAADVSLGNIYVSGVETISVPTDGSGTPTSIEIGEVNTFNIPVYLMQEDSTIITLNPNKNVGIGTTSPNASYKLHVIGKGAFTDGLVIPSQGSTLQFAAHNGEFYQFTETGTDKFYISYNATGSSDIAFTIDDSKRIGIGTNSPTGILDVASTTKTSLPFPRMTSTQRTSISTPPIGSHVYQTDGTEGVYVYKSTGWELAY